MRGNNSKIIDNLISIYNEYFINYAFYELLYFCDEAGIMYYSTRNFNYCLNRHDDLLNYNLLYYKFKYVFFNDINNINLYYIINNDTFVSLYSAKMYPVIFSNIIINRIKNNNLYKWTYNRRVWIYLSVKGYSI